MMLSFSFDHDSNTSESNFKKTIEYSGKDGISYDSDLGTYISQIAPLDSTKFCYFYKSTIGCGDVKDNTHKDIIKLEENREVTNLVSIDSNRVVYSLGSSVMLYSIDTEESSELYGSDYTVIPYTMEYDRDQDILVFGTQKVSYGKSSYNLPIISIK
jgi:hypothetical protein